MVLSLHKERFPCQHRGEDFVVIADIMRAHRPRVVVELGTDRGGFAGFLAETAAEWGAEVYTFDVAQKFDPALLELHANLYFVQADVLAQAHPRVSDLVSRPGAMVYCDDGNKRREIELYAPLLRAGSLLATHDYQTEVPASWVEPLVCGLGYTPEGHDRMEALRSEWYPEPMTRFWLRRDPPPAPTPHDYEVVVTAVTERADLFAQTMESMLQHVDAPPRRILVHEDVRPSRGAPGEIEAWLARCRSERGIDYAHKATAPAQQLARAMKWLLEEARTPIVFYTQEDWGFMRPVPVSAALDLMWNRDLHHIRFNKRKTLRAKHADTPKPWYKIEVEVGGRTLCVSDHWYFQPSLWRVEPAREAAAEIVARGRSDELPAYGFNHALDAWMNRRFAEPGIWTGDPFMRHRALKTYIWGPIGEPPYVEHIGTARGTGPILDHRGA